MKIKKLLIFLFAAAIILTLASCNENEVVYYTVKIDQNNGTLAQELILANGTKITKPEDPVLDGYTFIGWFVGDTLWDFENGTVSQDTTLKAKFTKTEYAVTFLYGDSSSKVTASAGNKIAEPEKPARENYDFVGWFIGSRMWNFDIDTVTSDITLSAVWNKIPQFTVKFDTDGGTPVAAQAVYRDSAAQTPAPTTKADHDFAGWYLGDTPWDFNTPITESITLTAKWTPYPTYTVTFDTDGGTEIHPQYIVSGKQATQPVNNPTKHASTFDGWFFGDDEWDFSTPITQNITITARWIAHETYTVTFSRGNIDLRDPYYIVPDQYVIDGDKITEPPLPDVNPETGYAFLGWYTDPNDRSTQWNFETDTVTSDITLHPIMLPTYKVTVKFSSDADAESVTYIIVEGERLSPIAPPTHENPDKWKFDGWYIYEEVEYDFNAPVTDNIVIFATWRAELPPHYFTPQE